MHDDYVKRDFSDLNKRVLVPIHRLASQALPEHVRTMERVACKHGDACRWSPGMVHLVAPDPPGGSMALGTYPVPKSGEQGLRPNNRQRRAIKRAQRQAQARTDRIVRSLAFGPTHKERVAKQHAIRNAEHVQQEVTRLTDRVLELESNGRKPSRKRSKKARDIILERLKADARERVDWDRKP